MQRFVSSGLLIALVVVFAENILVGENKASQADTGNSRDFYLDYGVTLKELPHGSRVRIWLPVPQSNRHQTIRVLNLDLPSEGKISIEPIYGNKILYSETKGPRGGRLPCTASYLVHRREVRGLTGGHSRTELSDAQRKLFLSANQKVPLAGKQLDLLEGIKFSNDPLIIARRLYERVDAHVRYDKSQPGYGNGDVLWVCDSRFGNCTDFHSLFISWARAKGLPARFEIGFPLPSERGKGAINGYHCWAMFHSNKQGWVPVDISEADKRPRMSQYFFGNLTEDRVAFTIGRDIELVPRQDGSPLNFFIYPYVEVDSKPWPTEKVQLAFSYADVKRKQIP